MSVQPDYKFESSDELDFGDDQANVADFELDSAPIENKKSKHNNKRNFEAKKRIEQLQEERRLKKFDENYYDDWD